MNYEKIKEECLRRMKMLKLHDEGEFTCVGDFRKNDKAWKSEFLGILYWLNEEEEKAVAKFEKEHKGLKVYHCIKNHTEFGELLTMLYVNGRSQEEFEEDVTYFDYDIKNGFCMTYVCNMTDEWSSTFGSVGIQSLNGGVKRTC
ncbi:MAG: hypothetical protein J6J36_06835 [Clostridia bacterium]|nr:hypothetical protein [Clostridia bacterium]